MNFYDEFSYYEQITLKLLFDLRDFLVDNPQYQVLLNYMQELSAKIEWQNIGLSQILYEIVPNNDGFEPPEGFPSLPLETEESFVGFNDHLDNKVLYGHMVSFLSLFIMQVLLCIH